MKESQSRKDRLKKIYDKDLGPKDLEDSIVGTRKRSYEPKEQPNSNIRDIRKKILEKMKKKN